MKKKATIIIFSIGLIAASLYAVYRVDAARSYLKWTLLLLASTLGATSAFIEYKNPKKPIKHLVALTSLFTSLAFILEGVPKATSQAALESVSKVQQWQAATNEGADRLLQSIGLAQAARAGTKIPVAEIEKSIIALDERIAAGEQIIDALAEAYFYRGRLEWHVLRLEKSAFSFRAAIKLRPDESRYFVRLCSTLRQLGSKAEAVKACRIAVRLDGKSSEAWNNLGNALEQFEEARGALEMAARLAPKTVQPWHNLAVLYYSQDKHKNAMTYVEKALALNPRFVDALNLKGAILNEAGRNEEAVATYHKALKINPDNALVWTNMGNALADLDRFTEAFSAYRSALLVDDNYAEGYFNYGFNLNVAGRPAEAVIYLRKAVEINPKDVDAFVELIKSYSAIGQDSQIVSTIDLALSAGIPEKSLSAAFVASERKDLASLVSGKSRREPLTPAAKKKTVF